MKKLKLLLTSFIGFVIAAFSIAVSIFSIKNKKLKKENEILENKSNQYFNNIHALKKNAQDNDEIDFQRKQTENLDEKDALGVIIKLNNSKVKK